MKLIIANFIPLAAALAAILFNGWLIKRTGDEAYKRGMDVSDAAWRAALAKAEAETAQEQAAAQIKAAEAEMQARDKAQALEAELKELEAENEELEKQEQEAGSAAGATGNDKRSDACGFDAAHISLLRGRAAAAD